MAVAHFAFDLGLRHERRDRVQHDDVNRARTDEGIHDFQGFLACRRLGDQQLADVHAQIPGIFRVHGVLGIDKGSNAAEALGFGNNVVGDSRLARRLRPVNFGDTSAWHSPHPERDIQGQRPGRDRFHFLVGPFAQAHDTSFAELFLELRQCHFEGFVFIQWFLLVA